MRLAVNIFFLLLLHLSLLPDCKAQLQKKYSILWTNVNELTAKGLIKDAQNVVDAIYVLAKKERQDAQLIKALVFQMSLRESVEEDAALRGLEALETEIKTSNTTAAAILNSVLAEKVWHYFQQNRWQLYNRTTIATAKFNHISSWSVSDFHSKISSLYLASVQNTISLQKTRLEPFDALIVKGNARYLRPTLYDLLANRALDYFRNDERDVIKPAYAFTIADENYFSPAQKFGGLSISTRDSSSLLHKAIVIYQELIRFHATDASPDALIDADIARLSLAYQYGVMENKEALYVNALQHLIQRYASQPAATQASYLLAQWHVKNAAQYNPLKDTVYRYEYQAAVLICEKIVQQKVASEGKSNCLALLQQIRHQELTLQTEKVNLPDLPFRTMVSFRNIGKVYFRIIPLTEPLKKQLNDRNDDLYWKQLTDLKYNRNWSQIFPSTKDFHQHSAEIKVDALPVGAYALLASTNENFSLDNNPMAFQYFHVSSISYLNNGNDYFVLHRETGKPLPEAAVQVWLQNYDYNSRQYLLSKSGSVMSDGNGYFKLPSTGGRQDNNIRLEIHYKKDRLFLDENQYSSYRTAGIGDSVAGTALLYERNHTQAFFFMDRSIYRPSQTVFFKGILITKDFETRKSKVYANQKTTVKLLNANGEPVDSLELTSNEFGSYSGRFTLPQNILNGEFRLADDAMKGEISFSVEEYKRPKFYVGYEKVKGTYKVNDSIFFSGFAKAYAGNDVSGAKVTYRIVREARFIYPWLFWKRGMPRGSNMEISNGTLTTDANGKFDVRFKAIPDLTINKEFDPVFDFKIIADITDINGETRSGEITIPVSYKTLQVKINLPAGDLISKDSLTYLSIRTQNLMGDFEPALVHVNVHRLQSPSRLIRQRFWEEPDQFVIGRDEYLKLFPSDEYAHETDFRTWSKIEKSLEALDSSKPNGVFYIRKSAFKEGWYVIEVTAKDKEGTEVKDMQYIQLFDEKATTLPAPQYAWGTQNIKPTEPGNVSYTRIGSSATDLYVIQHIDKQLHEAATFEQAGISSTSSTYNYIRLNNEKKIIEFAVTEKERGGFGVYHFFVRNNRFHFLSNQVLVPWTNKELVVSYETSRDKTLPGSEEKWRIRISGSKTEKVAAEMLASMYDASLDQFKPHSWSVPGVWPIYNALYRWNGFNNFTGVQSQQKYVHHESRNVFTKIYDRFIPLNNLGYNTRIRGRSDMMADQSLISEAPGLEMSKGKKQTMMAPGQGEADVSTVNARIGNTSQDQERKSKNLASPQQQEPVNQLRRNFIETAFFLPDLKTDSAGTIEFGFTVPEALTRWKFQALAITREAAFGYTTMDLITQKQLMVQPNAPRFLREGDHITLSTKIVNMTTREITGTVHLELLNAATMQPVDGWFQNMTANQYFTADPGQSIAASFNIQVPYQYNNALIYRFVAKAPLDAADSLAASQTKSGREKNAFISDAEEAFLPVLSNALLVTESMPLPVRGNATRNFRFEKLLRSGTSETLHHNSITVEFTSNPAWYAVQSLPYLSAKMYECSEQSFNQFYANALAAKIAGASPRIMNIFNKWKTAAGEKGGQNERSFLSNLQINQELKSVLLEETPWVIDSKNEAQQRKNIALLFDVTRMAIESASSLDALKQFQTSNGGFAWFKGGPDDRYMTQYILTGIGHLKKLGALPSTVNVKVQGMVQAGIAYLDERLQEDYQQLVKNKSNLKLNNLGYLQVQYLYMRSFFREITTASNHTRAVNYYSGQSRQFWLQQSRYMEGMIALTLFRNGDVETAGNILRSLKQYSISNEELGMYWKENKVGYFWYQAPVETQSLMIEAFSEISGDNKTVDDLRTWLLKQKQTTHWKSTKATADACYALLLAGTDWLSAEPLVEIKLGDQTINRIQVAPDEGTGYFKKVFDAPFVNPSMGEITVKVTSPSSPSQQDTGPVAGYNGKSAWGAVYWQYFENLDKITTSATPLKLVKKLFIQKNSDRGPILQPVKDGDALSTGDKIIVRIELLVDRDMEYLHMKDLRAACMEPVNVLSSYKWQGGLGYYETAKDASTHFFFSRLAKGAYVFEYPLFVGSRGNFSNGVTSIQCMYAPEFSSYSEGIRVNVE
ncbi:MAG: alpha-2-macroglobulin family protein [Chitinophagaceae bacterium]